MLQTDVATEYVGRTESGNHKMQSNKGYTMEEGRPMSKWSHEELKKMILLKAEEKEIM